MGLFSKKKGGTFFGNLIGSVASKATGGFLGGKRSAALQSGDLSSINSTAKKTGKMLKNFQGTFAGEPATQEGDTVTMTNPLEEVIIKSPPRSASAMRTPEFNPDTNPWLRKAGDVFGYFGKRASEETKFGMDDKTLMLVGVAALGILFMAFNNNRR